MSCRLDLPARLDTAASHELADRLRQMRGRDIVLEAGAVEHLGAHAAQTLMIAAASWAADGHALRLSGLSDSAAAHLAALGIAPETIATEGAPAGTRGGESAPEPGETST